MHKSTPSTTLMKKTALLLYILLLSLHAIAQTDSINLRQGLENVKKQLDAKYDVVWFNKDEYRYGYYLAKQNNSDTMDMYSLGGKLLFHGLKSDMKYPHEGLVPIMKDGLWGYADILTAKMIIPAQYTSVGSFSNGVAQVSKGQEIMMISNPLIDGTSRTVSSVTLTGQKSDIDINIPKSDRKQPNTFVVIIANANYDNDWLPYAIADGKTFKQYCLNTLGVPERNVMYYEDATLNVFHSVITRLTDIADVFDGEAKIILYFSGRGVNGNDGIHYILPTDVNKKILSQSAVSLNSIYDALGKMDIESAIVFLEADFNSINQYGTPKNNSPVTVKGKNQPTAGRVAVISAATEGQVALGLKEAGHGLFTYHLCKVLQHSRGDIDIMHLFDSLRKGIAEDNNNQEPKLKYTQNIEPQKIML